MADLQFGNDSVLWYNVGAWEKLGLGVPNFGDDTHTQNAYIDRFVRDVGRSMQLVMFSADARQAGPPRLETLIEIHKLCVRCRDMLTLWTTPSNAVGLRPTHSAPAPEVFRVFPVPYFEVPNTWLRTYCSLAMMALTDAMQHTDNARQMSISPEFSGDVGQYIQEIYRLMAGELFFVPAELAGKKDFILTDEIFATYNPLSRITRTERMNPVPTVIDWPTEDDKKILTVGIPVTLLPKLGPYPSGTVTGTGGASSNTTVAGNSFASPII